MIVRYGWERELVCFSALLLGRALSERSMPWVETTGPPLRTSGKDPLAFLRPSLSL